MRRWYEPRNDRPDIPKDAPKKKGFARFFETIWREFFNLLKLNLLFVLSCIPIVTIPAALTAMSRICVTMVWDQNSFMWHDYWTAFKRDFWQSTIGGLVFALALAAFSISTWFYNQMALANQIFMIFAAISGCMILLTLVAAMYYFPMVAMVALPTGKMLKNAVVLPFLAMKRTLPAFLITLVLHILGIGMLPMSIIFVVAIEFSLCSFISCFFIVKPIEEKILGIEEEKPEQAAAAAAAHPDNAELLSAQLGEFPEWDEDESEEEEEEKEEAQEEDS